MLFHGFLAGLSELVGCCRRTVALLLPVVGMAKLDILFQFVVAVRSGFQTSRMVTASRT